MQTPPPVPRNAEPGAPLPPPLRAYAPDFARRLALVLRALAAVIARRLLGHPRLAGFIVPLWRHLARTAARAQNLARILAAGRLPRTRRPHASGPSGRPLFPASPQLLLAALGHEGATHIAQLRSLLAEARAAELLALVPRAGRLLRPLGRLLALPLPPPPAPAVASPPPPRPALGPQPVPALAANPA